ncbi:hypothetical protein T459_33554 [Capsicum annuum]|uniref:Flavin-containing monooxygenase n=1 Tax=Capsicum annuum TaxID=4072 RepID=A0A2G2XYK7_CAPAN|nr:hypothetical protein T459_33554 [Capsicum annuum]
MGRFSRVPNIPEFPGNKGPEAFEGEVIHSMDYSKMEPKTATNFVKGKHVAVVGFQKSEIMDIAMECSTRWAFSKFVESYIKRKNRLGQHGMVPEHSFLNDLSSCSLSVLPDGFYDRVEERSIKLIKKVEIVGFCKEGILLKGQAEPIKSDLVILATGFTGIDKLKHIFESPKYQEFIAGIDDSAAVPLYR